MNEYRILSKYDNKYSNQYRNVVCAIDNLETQMESLRSLHVLPVFDRMVLFLDKVLRYFLIKKIISIRSIRRDFIS